MFTILITGGTGMIGKALTKALLEKNYEVVILSRGGKSMVNSTASTGNIRYAEWNIEKQTIDEDAISKADYIIHLAGAGVADKRWSEKRKAEIVTSRIDSGRLLSDSLKKIPNKVKAVISASAIGWYGADPAIPNPRPFKENFPADDQFLGKTCQQWEEAIEPVNQSGKRLVKLRLGIVLSKSGGALVEFKKPLQFGIAAILGTGKQIISWIHIDDVVKLFITALENENMKGVYNAVAPNPVSNKELTTQLAKTKRGRFFIPMNVPSFVLKLLLGEMSVEVLKSATVSCEKIQQTGFEFQFPTIENALKDLQ